MTEQQAPSTGNGASELVAARRKRYDSRPTVSADVLRNAMRRLGLKPRELAKGIGCSKTQVSSMLTSGKVPLHYALAAEALVRRQGSGGQDELFLLRMVKGVPSCQALGDCEEATIGGRVYLLVPRDAGAKS